MMWKKKYLFLLTCLSSLSVVSACNSKENNEDVIVYDKVISESFGGLGVEWGTYENTEKLVTGAWDRITTAVDRLKPKFARCMTNFEWIVKDFDNAGTIDTSDDTWTYDFNNKYMNNACQILDYCETHDIDVAFGVWNVIGNADESDDWGMIQSVTSDPRWAILCADLVEWLVNVKGYSCVKYFVSTNEPNYTGAYGSSKNAYNTYDIWEQGVKNVRKAFDERGLKHVDIIGGDTTGFIGCSEYLPNIATYIPDCVNNYGIHMYISNYDIDNGIFQSNLTKLYDAVKKIDNTLGVDKQMLIWEAGLLDGKNTTTDCNAYIGNFSYGIRMADYTLQSVLAGLNGVVYWDLDDAMHFMYTEAGATPKEWGMFSTLNDSTSFKQEYRPWYHSSTLLTNLLDRGARIYKSDYDDASFRTIASIDPDGKNGGIVAVNRHKEAITKSFRIEKKIDNEDGKIYVYVFNETNLRIGADGFVTYNAVIDGSLNDETKIDIPANSMVVLSTRRL